MATMLCVPSSTIKGKVPKQKPLTSSIELCKRSVVGARGFEPPTSCTPCRRAIVPFPDRLQPRFLDVIRPQLITNSADVSTLRLSKRGLL